MNKKITIWIIIVATLLLVLGQNFFLTLGYSEKLNNGFGWLIMLAVAIGISICIWLFDFLINKLIDGKPVDLFGLSTTARTGSKVGAYIGGYGSYPFALFLGFVGGGSVGGGLGEWLGLGNIGIILGVGFGVFLVTSFVCLFAIVAGFILGGFTEKLARTLHY